MADADWGKYKQLRGAALPEVFTFRGVEYARSKLLKRDFYAAVGLYQCDDLPADAPRQVLLKIYHTDPLWGFPLGWLGRWLARRERMAGEALAGISGVPRQLAAWGDAGFVREYVPGCNLREYRAVTLPERAFYLELRRILDEVHARGISHNDLAKPENIVVTEEGRPVLIDFQIALGPRLPRLPGIRWLAKRFVSYMQGIDRYHLAKQHTHDRPGDFDAEGYRLARRKGALLRLHGVLLRRPYRAVRHFVLRRWLLEDGARRAA